MEDILKQKGRIFDIQRYSIHDGPGIRTIVFLKGCNFRCKWCCNPESQNKEIETMQYNGLPKVMGKDVTVGEVMEEVIRDSVYYRYSGGGLTLSGGEALLQPDFASSLLMAAKHEGFTTAIESTGDADFEMIREKILPYLDVFLMDIKHINSEKHFKFTGKHNEMLLENAKKIGSTGQNLIIRVPVIPNFNDSIEEISDIVNFAKGINGVKEINLLPYHPYGVDKYNGLGRKYTLGDLIPPSREHMETLVSVANKLSDLKISIGG